MMFKLLIFWLAALFPDVDKPNAGNTELEKER